MRVIVILILIVIALAMARSLVNEVSRAALKGWKKGEAERKSAGAGGKLVQDPETGAYVDPTAALHAEVDGTIFYFESDESRQAFLRRRKGV